MLTEKEDLKLAAESAEARDMQTRLFSVIERDGKNNSHVQLPLPVLEQRSVRANGAESAEERQTRLQCAVA